MKRKIFVLFFLLAFLLTPISISADNEAYRINDYHVDLTLKTNGEYQIVETIKVFFNYPSRGIYRNLISRSTINWGEIVPGEKEVSENYYFPIKNIKVLDHQTLVENFPDGVRIRIGNPNQYLSGAVDYVISYTMVSQPLRHKELGQLLYVNLNGLDWDVFTDRFRFTINYPKEVNFTDFLTYVGAGGSTDTNRTHCAFDPAGTKVECEAIGGLRPFENVTVLHKLAVDDSYIVYPNYDFYYYLTSGIALVLVAFALRSFLKDGKDEPLVKTIEFSAPVGLNSAEVGYIYDDLIDNKDVISLILEWAKDGYLIIHDDEGQVSFQKVRDLTGVRPEYELRLFKRLFEDGDEVATSSLKEKFYHYINQARQSVMKKFQEEKYLLYESKSLTLQVFYVFLAALPIVLLLNMGIFLTGITMVRKTSFVAYLILSFTSLILIIGFKKALRNKPRQAMLTMFTILLFEFLVSGVLLLPSLKILNIPTLAAMITWLAAMAIILFASVMDKRTEFGLRVFGQVLGLEEFIRFAYKYQLDMLAQENPYIFYDVLPYAYALNLTDVWAEQFKDLVIPEAEFYQSSSGDMMNAYMFNRAFTNSMMIANTNLTTLPAPKSSSGSFRGGGGSFGGSGGSFGGGSSGGGFGGGGGGRW